MDSRGAANGRNDGPIGHMVPSREKWPTVSMRNTDETNCLMRNTDETKRCLKLPKRFNSNTKRIFDQIITEVTVCLRCVVTVVVTVVTVFGHVGGHGLVTV